MSDIGRELEVLRRRVDASKKRHIEASREVRSERKHLAEARRTLKSATRAREIIQQVAQTVQQAAHAKIASVVSRCLEAVFDDPFEFRITFEKKRGRTEAKLSFFRRGMEIDPKASSMGAMIDVAAFALRLSSLLFSRPPRRKVIVTDEPFRFLDRDNAARIGAMLSSLAHELGVQIIIVTHDPVLQIGKIVNLD